MTTPAFRHPEITALYKLLVISLDKDGTELRPLILPVKRRLMELDGFLSEGKAAADGRSIDVIYDHHFYSGDSLDGIEAKSQDRVYELLVAGHYDVIGDEGTACNPVTIECMQIRLQAWARRVGRPDADSIMLDPVSIRTSGTLRFLTDHPDHGWIVGFVDDDLVDLHQRVLAILPPKDSRGARADRLYAMHAALTDVRSLYGISRVTTELAHRGQTRGALVIGQTHRHNMEEFAKAWGFILTPHETL